MHDQADDTTRVERLLESSRPLPSPSFRGDLRRMLVAKRRPARPRRLRLMVFGYACSGSLFLAVAALGVAGGGPLAA